MRNETGPVTTSQFGATRGTKRRRPYVHFTAADSWVNDPYGVTWDAGQYHLFYQTLPGRLAWAPECHWGHCVSPDLVHWRELPVALSPAPFETGCWSGSYLSEGPDGMPAILYTRVAGEDWDLGQVAIAHGSADSIVWTTGVDDVVISGAPAELNVTAFRDPYVWKANGGWEMIVGAALADDTAAALHYRSSDLQHWFYEGVLCSRSADESEGAWTGKLWECPQFFALGDKWVLLVSVWSDDDLHYVAGAIGDWNGARFEPGRWQQLTYGSSAYAMTTFLDAEGRRCVMSWLREEPRDNPNLQSFAGALSVAATLTIADGQLRLSPHPSVIDAVPSLSVGPGDRVHLSPPAAFMIAPTKDVRELAISDHDGERCRIAFSERTTTVRRVGRDDEVLPSATTDGRLLLDEDILEVFSGGEYGAYRLRASAGADVVSC